MSDMLTNEQVQALDQIKINSGGNFLNGGVTSVFASTVQTAGAGVGILAEGINATAMVADITAAFITKLQSDLLSYVSLSTVELMKIPTETIAYWTSETIKANQISPSQIVKELTMGAEDFASYVNKQMEDKQNLEIAANASKKVKEVTEKVTYAMGKATEQLNSITAYITKGPEWIEKQLTKCSNTIMEQTMKGIGSTTESFKQIKDTWAEGFGKSMGEKVVTPINEKTKNAQKKILDSIEEKKNNLKTKAGAAVAQATMKLKGILGG